MFGCSISCYTAHWHTCFPWWYHGGQPIETPAVTAPGTLRKNFLCRTWCVMEGRVCSSNALNSSRLCSAILSCRHRGAGILSLVDRTYSKVGLHAHTTSCKSLHRKNRQQVIQSSSYTQCRAGHSSSEQELCSQAVPSGHLDEVAVARTAVSLASKLCTVSTESVGWNCYCQLLTICWLPISLNLERQASSC